MRTNIDGGSIRTVPFKLKAKHCHAWLDRIYFAFVVQTLRCILSLIFNEFYSFSINSLFHLPKALSGPVSIRQSVHFPNSLFAPINFFKYLCSLYRISEDIHATYLPNWLSELFKCFNSSQLGILRVNQTKMFYWNSSEYLQNGGDYTQGK